jgi:glucan phosphoethanolaminetransferase (alkaline phosphatase superfamily)
MKYLFPLRKDSVILLSNMERDIMTNEEIDQYNDALNEAKKSEAAALKAALPKKLFGITIALIVGGLVATNGSEYFQYSGYLIIGLGLVIAIHQQQTGATPLLTTNKKMGISALLLIILFFLLITAIVRYTTAQLGLTWTPLLGGGLVGAIVYMLAKSKREKYITIIKEAGLEINDDA